MGVGAKGWVYSFYECVEVYCGCMGGCGLNIFDGWVGVDGGGWRYILGE